MPPILSSCSPRAIGLSSLLAVFVGLATGGVFTVLASQAQPPVEETEPTPPPKKKVIPIDDGIAGKPGPTAPPSRPQDLNAALQQAKHPGVKLLFESLKVAHDEVHTRSGQVYEVTPLRPYIGDHARDLPETKITLQTLKQNWSPDKVVSLSPNAIAKVISYEELALQGVESFLAKGYENQPSTQGAVTKLQVLQAAETALSFVEREHRAMLDQHRREGSGWDKIGNELNAKRLELRLRELEQAVVGKDWEAVAVVARELAEAFPKPDSRKRLNDRLQRYVTEALRAAGNDNAPLLAMVKALRPLEDRFPDIQATAPADEHLRKQAEELFEQGKKLLEVKKTQEGVEKLRLAEQLWPRLPGLRDLTLNAGGAYTTLNVGVRQLPIYILPGLAFTDSERQAVELIYEGLVRAQDDSRVGQRYFPCLALGAPRVVPMGREFELPRDAYWPEGRWVKKSRPVEIGDIRQSIRLLKNPRYPGYQPAWGKLVEDVQMAEGRHITLTLKHGCLDPLEFMTFKILPQGVASDRLIDFAKQPAGTGPFEYQGRDKTPDGQDCAKFVANPNFGSRAGRLGLPMIREIDMIVTDDPVKDLKAGKIDLCADVPTDKLNELKSAPGVKLLPPQPNLRVYFLAINHRHTDLRNQDLRQAIAMAINREQVLDQVFRVGLKEKVHKALRGPYPADSWAYELPGKPGVDPLYSAAKASAKLTDADKADVRTKQEFDLLYPDGDANVKKAMELVAAQLKQIGLKIKLKPLSPNDLREAVEVKFSYHLAYYWHDYPSEAYWLSPLFDPNVEARESGACNFLGYMPDSELQSAFGRAEGRRNFEEVKRETWLIGEMLEKRMPLIPLWQLDRHIAYRTDLKLPGPIDPLLVFTDVEHWRKVKGE